MRDVIEEYDELCKEIGLAEEAYLEDTSSVEKGDRVRESHTQMTEFLLDKMDVFKAALRLEESKLNYEANVLERKSKQNRVWTGPGLTETRVKIYNFRTKYIKFLD